MITSVCARVCVLCKFRINLFCFTVSECNRHTLPVGGRWDSLHLTGSDILPEFTMTVAPEQRSPICCKKKAFALLKVSFSSSIFVSHASRDRAERVFWLGFLMFPVHSYKPSLNCLWRALSYLNQAALCNHVIRAALAMTMINRWVYASNLVLSNMKEIM